MEQHSLYGKTSIITGSNSGIGLETANTFAEQGARVIMAVRNIEKGYAARDLIKKDHPHAEVEVMELDLADLDSIRFFAERFQDKFPSLDLLINNAGVMTPPYAKTKDGFELQFGSNHLGHFALTGHLLPLLSATPDSRVVTVSSLAHKGADIFFDNLDGTNGYKAMKFYGQSKLANLMFAQELDERLKQHGQSTMSIACHPGISATNLFKFGGKDAPNFMKGILYKFLQPADMGALPTIFAAMSPSLKGGEYIGPDGKGQRKGYPAIDTPHPVASNKAVSLKLWDVSEQLTGVTFNF
jgi:NAD(P)-dependent dehydrogenase (short-subunit alcohol dehydrogenase family)